MLRGSLRTVASRWQGRRAPGVTCAADFSDRVQRLNAELAYQTQFRPNFNTMTGEYETGLVSGAKVVRDFVGDW